MFTSLWYFTFSVLSSSVDIAPFLNLIAKGQLFDNFAQEECVIIQAKSYI